MSSNTSESQEPEPSYGELAGRLKTIAKHSYTDYLDNLKTIDAVVAFDCSLFQMVCCKSSMAYNPSYSDFGKLCDAIFKPGEMWISRDLMVIAVNQIANQEGWLAKCDKRGIFCDRVGVPTEDISTSQFLQKEFTHTKLAKDCKWSTYLLGFIGKGTIFTRRQQSQVKSLPIQRFMGQTC